MPYQKYIENEEIHKTRVSQETREYLECYPSPLFYEETPLHSSPTISYGLDSKIIERPPVTMTAETEQFPHESISSCPLLFESKLDKTNTANRNKRFINAEKGLEVQCDKHNVEYVSPIPGKLPNSTKARRKKLLK